MEQLLIQPSEITENTPLGGNVDVDKYLPLIIDVQLLVIEPLIGTVLYETLKTQTASNTLTADNLIIVNDYLKPILRHQVCAEYIEQGAYTIANGGVFRHQPKDSTVLDKAELIYFAGIQRSKAQTYIDRYLKKYGSLDCGLNKLNKTTGGWYL